VHPHQVSLFKQNLLATLVGVLLIHLGHLLNVGFCLFMVFLNKLSTLADEDIPNDVESPPITRDYDSRYSEQESNVYKGPMTRAKMRHLQHEVKSLLIDYEHASTKNYLLPNNGALLVLRF
jgi:hypothetical protein